MLTTIPLDRLTLAEGNIRRSGGLAIDELAASILAHGLIQNLTVRPLAGENGKPSDRYEVVAGGRRLRAMQQLAKAHKLEKGHPVACRVLDRFSPTEIGLAENVFQLPMHPHDQYLAFTRLHDEGQPAADIAARFGVSERIVLQRLRLGRVAPALLATYRDGAMTLDTLMAFTVSDDHGEQERVWNEIPAWNRHPEIIRRHLTTAHLAAGDRVARFVGIDAYEAAGGTVLRDLFDDARCWLTDPPLIHRLAAERLETEAATLRDAGWRWVLVGIERPLLQPAGRVYATHREPAETEQAEMDRLGGRLAEIEEIMASEGLDEADGNRLTAEQEGLEAALTSLHAGLSGFTEEDKARSGCLVHLDPCGDLAVDRGLVRDEDRAAPAASDPAIAEDEAAADAGTIAQPPHAAEPPPKVEGKGSKPLAASLIEELSAYRTAGMQIALARQPDVAMIALTHALASEVFGGYGRRTCLGLRVIEPHLPRSTSNIDDSPAGKALGESRASWGALLPADSADLWDWITAQDEATRRALLAFCVGISVNALAPAQPSSTLRTTNPADADRLAVASGLDMREWWQPTRAAFLDRASKAQILAAVAEAAGEAKARRLDGLKKAALAELAEPILTAARWLPETLRSPSDDATPRASEDHEAASRLQAA